MIVHRVQDSASVIYTNGELGNVLRLFKKLDEEKKRMWRLESKGFRRRQVHRRYYKRFKRVTRLTKKLTYHVRQFQLGQ